MGRKKSKIIGDQVWTENRFGFNDSEREGRWTISWPVIDMLQNCGIVKKSII